VPPRNNQTVALLGWMNVHECQGIRILNEQFAPACAGSDWQNTHAVSVTVMCCVFLFGVLGASSWPASSRRMMKLPPS
jgi:hypothetical protein